MCCKMTFQPTTDCIYDDGLIRPSRKFTVKRLAESFSVCSEVLKKFENVNPSTEMFSFIERGVFMVCYLLTNKSMMKKRSKLCKSPWRYF